MPMLRWRCLVLHDGTLSTLNQCVALWAGLKRLHHKVELVGKCQVEFGNVWFEKMPPLAHILLGKVTGNRLVGFSQRNVREMVQLVMEQEVDTIIACGRRTAACSYGLKQLVPDRKVINIQLLNPRCGQSWFDFIVTPKHDRMEGDKVFSTYGALTWVNPSALAEAQEQGEPMLKTRKNELLVIFCGGDTSRKRMDVDIVCSEMEEIIQRARENDFDVFVVGSRRTPKELFTRLSHLRNLKLWHPLLDHGVNLDDTNPRDPLLALEKENRNPYRSCLVHGDAFVVTGDSVSMISDACSTGKRVAVIQNGVDQSPKLTRFHENMIKFYTSNQEITTKGEEQQARPCLDDAGDAARFILQSLAVKVQT